MLSSSGSADEEPNMKVLVSLSKGYGLGDAVQMSVVLRHIKKYRPQWEVTFQAEDGRHQVGRRIVQRTMAYGQMYHDLYDAEVQIRLYDTWHRFTDRPNTRVSSCLLEHFGLEWDAECGRYQINVGRDALREIAGLVSHRSVAIHYQGDTAQENKNLSHDQAAEVCSTVMRLGRFPLLLDWRNQSPLRHLTGVRSMGGYPPSRDWGRNAEMNCAVIQQCQAFVGIDSGPGKCASATDTPSLIVWTGHHPVQFHDPAPNTTHLVPMRYHSLKPVCNDQKVINWFESNYNVFRYENNPAVAIKSWLREVLR